MSLIYAEVGLWNAHRATRGGEIWVEWGRTAKNAAGFGETLQSSGRRQLIYGAVAKNCNAQ